MTACGAQQKFRDIDTHTQTCSHFKPSLHREVTSDELECARWDRVLNKWAKQDYTSLTSSTPPPAPKAAQMGDRSSFPLRLSHL